MNHSSLAFVLPDGTRTEETGPCVLGRNPGRPGFASVALPDEEHVASKNHVVARAVGSLCEFTDLHSTNGSAVEVTGAWVQLVPGQPTHATLPCRLDCGGLILTVEAA